MKILYKVLGWIVSVLTCKFMLTKEEDFGQDGEVDEEDDDDDDDDDGM